MVPNYTFRKLQNAPSLNQEAALKSLAEKLKKQKPEGKNPPKKLDSLLKIPRPSTDSIEKAFGELKGKPLPNDNIDKLENLLKRKPKEKPSKRRLRDLIRKRIPKRRGPNPGDRQEPIPKSKPSIMPSTFGGRPRLI